MQMSIKYMAYKIAAPEPGSLWPYDPPVDDSAEGVHTRVVPLIPKPKASSVLSNLYNFKMVPKKDLPLYMDGVVHPFFEAELKRGRS
jgi:hypothetical protein